MFARRVSIGVLAAGVIVTLGWSGCTPDSASPSGEEASAPTGGAATSAPGTSASSSGDTGEAKAAQDAFAACIEQAESHMGEPACLDAAATLAQHGGAPLEATLRKLDDPNLSPHGKVMIVEGFKSRLDESSYDILKPLTATGKDEMTRLCATALLASIPDASLMPFLIPLADDPNPKLSFTALLGIAPGAQEGSEYRSRLKSKFSAPETTPNMREHVIGAIGQNPYPEDEELLIRGFQDTELNVEMRALAVTSLGRIGGEAALEALMAADLTDAPATFSDTVSLSVAALKERLYPDDNAIEIEIKTRPGEH